MVIMIWKYLDGFRYSRNIILTPNIDRSKAIKPPLVSTVSSNIAVTGTGFNNGKQSAELQAERESILETYNSLHTDRKIVLG